MLITIRIGSTINRRICLARFGTAFRRLVKLFTFTFNAIGVFGQQALVLTVFVIYQPILIQKSINDKKTNRNVLCIVKSFTVDEIKLEHEFIRRGNTHLTSWFCKVALDSTRNSNMY
jgi:hypothetical protein